MSTSMGASVSGLLGRPVVSIDRSGTLPDAARTMRDEDVGMLAVTAAGDVTAVVTDRDLCVRGSGRTGDIESLAVGDVSTSPVQTVDARADLVDVRTRLQQTGLQRLVVLDDAEQCLGVVTAGDLATAIDPDGLLAGINSAVEPTGRARQVHGRSVRDVARKPYAVGPGTTAGEIAAGMARNNVGVCLVTDSHGLRGIITDRDLTLRALARNVSDPWTIPAFELCTSAPVVIDPQADVGDATATMRVHHVRRLPAVESDGSVVGLVSVADLE